MDITVMLPAGRLPLNLMSKAEQIAQDNNLEIYLSTAQNLRILDVPDDKLDIIKADLISTGAVLKAPGKFPLPKVCVGKGHCKFGLIDPVELSAKILAKFGGRQGVKAKFKIAISACVLGCAGHRSVDIGVGMSKNGYEIFVGGKGGTSPKVGKRIARDLGDQEVLDIVGELVDFHDKHTPSKQRMFKLLSHPDFPYPNAI